MAISPGPLLSISATGDPVSVAQTNFEILTRDSYKFTPTHQSGVPTTLIGPPTAGAHTLDEKWVDAWSGTFRCTVAGTPGTWRQETPAVREGEPASGTIPTGYVILDSTDSYRKKIHLGSYVWGDDTFGHVTGLTGGGGSNLDGIVTASLAVGAIAQFIESGALVTYKLIAGTIAESSPHVIRPDDYNGVSNAKIWLRIIRSEYPGFFFSRVLTGLTGSTSVDLNFIPTTEMTVGQCIAFVVSSSFVIYRLRTGTDATASPTVIRPVDFQSVTNAKVWERVLIIATPGDALISNNDLSEINTAAKRISARSNLDVLWADDSRGMAEAHHPRGGLFSDGTASYLINGTSGIALGVGDFSISVIVALWSYTPGTAHILWTSHNAGNNRVLLGLSTGGAITLTFIDGAAASTVYSLTPDVTLEAGKDYQITVTADRDGVASLYINGIADRDKSGSGPTVSIAASSAVDIGSGNANVWGAVNATVGTVLAIRLFNRILSAADALQLAQEGRTSYADQWAAAAASYTSDFSAGVDSWASGAGVTLSGNIDAIGGEDNTLRITCDTGTSGHYAARVVAGTALKYQRARYRVYIPSANPTLKKVGISDTSGLVGIVSTLDTWVSVDVIARQDVSAFGLNGMNAAGNQVFTGSLSDIFYVKDFTMTASGALLDLDCHNADPAQSLTVRDRSSSANHGTAAASGITQVQKPEQLNPSRISIGSSTVLTKLLSATATLDFGSINAAASADLTITVTGAAVGDSVSLGLPAAPTAGIIFQGFVSASNTVTVRATNITGIAVDPASATYRATVFQF